MLPDILKQVTDAKSGAGFLTKLGVDKSFIGSQLGKYAPYISKIPGMNDTQASSLVNDLARSMPDSAPPVAPMATRPTAPRVDKGRYPKIG